MCAQVHLKKVQWKKINIIHVVILVISKHIY